MQKVLDEFISYLALKNFSPESLQVRRQSVEYFIRWKKEAGGSLEVQDVCLEDLKAYIEHLRARNLSLNTVSTWTYSLKCFFEYLEKNQIVLINPAEKLESPRLGERLPKNILSEEEVLKLLNAPDLTKPTGLRNRAIMELLYSTAIRREECARLKLQDVDLNGGYLRVNQGKGSRDRVVPLGKTACEYLKRYIEKVRVIWAEDSASDILFLTQFKKPMDAQMYNLLIKLYSRKLKLGKPVTTHSLRKAAVTHMLRGGAGPVYIQRMLGHSSNTTMIRYLKVTIKDVKEMHHARHPREKGGRHSHAAA